MSPIDPYLGAQAPTQDFLKAFLDREIPAGLLFYAPFWPQTGNQAWGVDKRIVVPTTEVVDADGSYFAKDGLIRRANLNSLKMESLGGLIEGARTNLQVRSEEFDNAAWTKVGITIAADDTPSPDGATTADRFTEQAMPGSHFAYDGVAVIGGQPYASTVYAKRGAVRDWIWMYGDSILARASAWFNINTGVVGNVVGTSAPWAAIERLPNGWFRCTLGWTATGGGVNHGHGLGSANGVSSYVGDANAYCWFWGAQVENGAFASSYIPTVAAAVARAQDNIQYASAGHIETTAGTIFVAITPEADSEDLTTVGFIFDSRTAAPLNGVHFEHNAGLNRLRYIVSNAGAPQCAIPSLAALDRGQTYIAAIVWATNDFRLYLDGNLQGSDVAGAVPAAHNASLFIGENQNSLVQVYANLAHLAIFNRAMAAPEIEQRSHFFRNQMARAS